MDCGRASGYCTVLTSFPSPFLPSVSECAIDGHIDFELAHQYRVILLYSVCFKNKVMATVQDDSDSTGSWLSMHVVLSLPTIYDLSFRIVYFLRASLSVNQQTFNCMCRFCKWPCLAIGYYHYLLTRLTHICSPPLSDRCPVSAHSRAADSLTDSKREQLSPGPSIPC